MINGLKSRGRYIYVHGGHASNYVTSQPGSLGIGNVRFNTSSQVFEIFDGMYWTALNLPTPVIGLNQEAEDLLDWVKVQRDKEAELMSLIQSNAAVKNAYNNLQKAKEQLDITIILSKNEKTSN